MTPILPFRVEKPGRVKGKSSRFYNVGGEQYPSVTTILQAVNKPALLNWAAKVEREMVLEVAADLYKEDSSLPRDMFIRLVHSRLKFTKAHEKELVKASDIGSQAHARIEWEFKREGPEPALEDKALWAFMAWQDWAKKVELEPVHVERVVFSKDYRYAGTLDLIGRMNLPFPNQGRGVVLLDWKTGSRVYPEALLQAAAYVRAADEMGLSEEPLHACVVRLPKKTDDPEFETRFIPRSELEELFEAFYHVLKVWGWLEEQ